MTQKPMLRCEVGCGIELAARVKSCVRWTWKASAGHCTCVWAVGVVSVLCVLGQIRACCCQGKFKPSPCARWVPFSAQRKRSESPYLVECAFLVLSRHRCRVLRKAYGSAPQMRGIRRHASEETESNISPLNLDFM